MIHLTFDYLYIIYIWFVHESYNHIYNCIKYYFIIHIIGEHSETKVLILGPP